MIGSNNVLEMKDEKLAKDFQAFIKNSNDEFINNDLIPFLRIPSNTLNQEGVLKAKNVLISYISDFCSEIKEYPGEINPLILAKVEGRIKDVLLIYMMYDTQPINKEKEWISPPFKALINVLPPPLDILGKCIVARGAYNSKTPLICFLNVVKALKKQNSLPISLLLLFDGEEEMGSPTLLKFLEKNDFLFDDCVDAYYPSIKQGIGGTAVLKLGYKGILSLTIKVYTENKEPHSAFSAMIPNPALDLISLLNTIYFNNEFQIESLKVPYKLTEEEELITNDLLEQINIENIKKKAGIVQVLENDYEQSFINYLFKPTFNISLISTSKYLEEGTKNYVPSQAICNIDIRFAHDVSVQEIFEEIKEKIDEFAKKSKSQIELIRNIGYEGSRVKKNSILVKSLFESFKRLGVPIEIWPLSAAAAPLSVIQGELGLNFIVGGLGIGGFAHSPNEFVQLDSIINTRLSFYYFLRTYSKLIEN